MVAFVVSTVVSTVMSEVLSTHEETRSGELKTSVLPVPSLLTRMTFVPD
jgi:hypothetical protein